MPSLGHNETLLHRESETPVCVFKTRGLVAPTLTIHKLRLPMWDNELTSMPSPLNFEPLQFQISCGEIGISERTEALPEGALQGCFGVKQQTQRLKKINMELFAQ
jgi:hypothetical protein